MVLQMVYLLVVLLLIFGKYQMNLMDNQFHSIHHNQHNSFHHNVNVNRCKQILIDTKFCKYLLNYNKYHKDDCLCR